MVNPLPSLSQKVCCVTYCQLEIKISFRSQGGQKKTLLFCEGNVCDLHFLLENEEGKVKSFSLITIKTNKSILLSSMPPWYSLPDTGKSFWKRQQYSEKRFSDSRWSIVIVPIYLPKMHTLKKPQHPPKTEKLLIHPK